MAIKDIFNKNKITRTQPEVESTSFNIDNVVNSYDSNDVISLAKELNFLLDGFSDIFSGYQKLLDILIRRANMRGISLDVKTLAAKNKGMSSALNVLYGKQVDSINFKSYIDILKKEHSNSASDINNLINDTESNGEESGKITNSIGIIKTEYTKYLIDKNATDLLKVYVILKNMQEAQSSYSAVDRSNTLSDGNKITDMPNAIKDKNKEDKIKELLNDCIPCLERNLNLLEAFSKSKIFTHFLVAMWSRYIAALKSFAAMKLSIIGSYFTPDICRLINYLTEYICIPDLKAINLLFKSLMFKYRKLIDYKMESLYLSIPGEPVVAIGTSAMDALLIVLGEFINIALSSIDCILLSMQNEISKIEGLDGVESDINDGRNQLYNSMGDFYSFISNGKKDIESYLYGLIDQINKKLKEEFKIEEDSLELWQNIDQISIYISILQEITTIAENFKDQISKNGFWDGLKKSICLAAMNGYPWLEDITDLLEDLRLDVIDEILNNQDSGDDSDDSGDNLDDEIIIGDTSLDDDIFEDDPVDKFLSDEEAIDKAKKIVTKDSIQDSNNIFKYDDEFFKNYLNQLNKYKRSSAILNDENVNNISFPVVRIDFRNCKAKFNINDSELQSWINKVKD